MKDVISWLLKGAAMGVAEGVPGVSGGTIALIMGIYERFISAIGSFKPSLWAYVKQKDYKGLWIAIDGRFLLSLGSAMLVSLFGTLTLMHVLLETKKPVVWAFFMGIILVSLVFMSMGKKWQLKDVFLLLGGVVISLALIFSTPTELEATPLVLIMGGAIAISAMILPGISGSFMLVLLGIFPVIVEAVHARDIIVVLWVALGCLIGILSFSQILQWLLKHWHDRVMSFMLGFVVGALVKVWPWQLEVEANNVWLWPSQYSQISQLPNYLTLSLIAFIAGSVLVALLTTRSRESD